MVSRILLLGLFLMFVQQSWGQSTEPVLRNGVLFNPDLYKQATPKECLASVLLAIERNRLDYLINYLIDPLTINERLKQTNDYYLKIAEGEIAPIPSGLSDIRQEAARRVRQDQVQARAARLGREAMALAIQKKLSDDPEALKDLRKFLSEGEFLDAGETATAILKDLPDRKLFFRKIPDPADPDKKSIWVFDNKKTE